MNDKDKEAFIEWENINEHLYLKGDLDQAWRAACKYKQKEYSNIMDAMAQTSQNNTKLLAENKKLRDALEQIKNLKLPEGFYDASFEIAKEALKEIKEN
jgi:translation initiation factor 2 alpha subunit (eIF-2alpha)